MPKTHADDRGSTNAAEDLAPVAPAVEPLPDVPAQRPGEMGGELTFGGSLGVTRPAAGKPDEKPEPEEKPKQDEKPRTMSRRRKSG